MAGVSSRELFPTARSLYLIVCCTWVLLFAFKPAGASEPVMSYQVSGHVRDAITNQSLPGATVKLGNTGRGTVTDAGGRFVITIGQNHNLLEVSFLGYEPVDVYIVPGKNAQLEIKLYPKPSSLPEVKIIGDELALGQRVALPRSDKLDASSISYIPALLGEVDPLKAIQLLPGISSSSEGSSWFSVRGGNPDQNLILLDGATVYNPGHMLGFFSVFNNDIVRDVTIYKGDIPSWAGRRLSSVIDVRGRDGNLDRFAGSAGIGLISSRFTFEGPVVKGKSSFLASARRSYLDLFLPLSNNEAVRNSRLYFFDVNLNFGFAINQNNSFSISSYLGRNVFTRDYSSFDYGNRIISARWDHSFSNRLSGTMIFSSSEYDYSLGSGGDRFQDVEWDSRLVDYSLGYNHRWFPATGHVVEYGLQAFLLSMESGNVTTATEGVSFRELNIPGTNSLENVAFVSHSWMPGPNWRVRYGLRWSLFHNIGSGRFLGLDQGFNVTDTTYHRRGRVFNTIPGLEPRFSVAWMVGPDITLKGAYSRTIQYVHLASNSVSSSPLDVWFTSSPNIGPRKANQVSAGFLFDPANGNWEISLQGFLKQINGSIDFRDHANLLLNEALEGEVRPGTSRARGMELFAGYFGNQFQGWLSYTLSRSVRESEWINNGVPYLSPFDRTHDIALVLNYEVSNRVTISGNWVWHTGAPVTWPVGRFDFQGSAVPIYALRNSERMPDYHRADISVTLKGKPGGINGLNGEWNFSIYNLYGRSNAWMINFTGDEEVNPFLRQAEMTYLFPVVPSITYTVSF